MSRPPWVITIDGAHPPSPNARLHHMARYRLCRPFQDTAAVQARALSVRQPLERAHLTATLVYTRRPFRDIDNATASLKPAIDGLVAGGLIASDTPAHLTLEVRQELGPRRCVTLEVTPGDTA